ncbi:protein phosphatase [Blastomyces dermatitidis ER-3]|uniref:Protein phosphatase 2C homolog 2 n=2 Tax=Ajellomyces dermatitidis TaxID=5039 RepID=F2TU26_AJEDA|nr:protein phosphatase [Blastomyces dermatitidis ER-3]EEQ86885.2 protein phosphatase [Blastomyces dermatitidis ER-3]EGE86739.2 protein phosphatase [Blastomyces dermatitidis ATCC 18188]EQL30717.1 protein phosphatase [Blastomyces dermatitidis ATCC 26199]EQL30718.1 protein phosphatase, variant [Blastomyces dermatitidis ATCC 26199]
MGQTLSEPVVEKISDEGQDECVLYGVSAMQGWRISMEDAHAAVLDLQAKYLDKAHRPTHPDKRLSFFGVYDGHGGEKVALFAGDNVHRIVTLQDSFAEGDIEQALKDGFLATDRAILEDPKYEEEVSGCTASVAVISKDKIRVANAGDSRSVLGVKGRAKPLSFDHKPQNEGEKARISAAGGFVDYGRVNGNLALSRALGDFEFKKSADLAPEQQIVTAYPDVTTHEITEDDEFLVIACDGIWDCQSSQAVIEFVRRGIAAKQELYRICENMMDNCLASNSETGGVGCDNMTMVIIGLLHGKSKEEWYKTIADRVANGDGPCAPPEYAEFRGPGVRRQGDEGLDDYEPDLDTRLRGGRSGRIILLGDGTEVLTDMGDDEDMFDHTEEDKDLESQVRKGGAGAERADSAEDTARSERGGTPGPLQQQGQQQQQSNRQGTPNAQSESPGVISASPSSTSPNDILRGSERRSTS